MTRSCVVCGADFETTSYRALTCSATCRSRKRRGNAIVAPVFDIQAGNVSNVETAVTAELEAANMTATIDGQMALLLARRIDQPGADSGSGLAALCKQLSAVINGIRRSSQSASVSPLDELLRKRKQRGNDR